MKNFRVEHLRIAAKLFHKYRSRIQLNNGIHIYHQYDGLDPERLSWWDDIAFVLNDYRVLLLWIHPRMAYRDFVDEETGRLGGGLPKLDLFSQATPVYQATGKSRKTIVGWESHLNHPDDWFDIFEAQKKVLAESSDFYVVPYLKSHWTAKYRVVRLCVPIEVRNAHDLRELAALTKQLLKRERSLAEIFPSYRYGKDDWKRDSALVQENSLHTHRVAV